MRILIIHNRYSQLGGEEKVVETQARLLRETGNDVYEYIRDYHEMDNWIFGKVQSLFSSLYSRKSISEIKEIIRSFNPETAIVHNLFPIISAAIIKELKINGIPVALTVHNYRLFCPTGLFFRRGKICTECAEKNKNHNLREFNCLLNKCEGTLAGSFGFALRSWWSRQKKYFGYVDLFMSVSEFQKRNLIKYGIREDRIIVIPNCTSQFEVPGTTIQCKKNKQNYIAFVGRLSPEKGIDLLFEIASRLPRVHFKVAGKKAKGLKLTEIPNNIELLGHLQGDNLQNLYINATALLFTSKVWEAMPLSPLEAMSHGTAVIANRVSSIPEIIEDGVSGMIFEGAEEGANKILELIANPELRERFENNGIERIRNYYSEIQYASSVNKACKLLTERQK